MHFKIAFIGLLFAATTQSAAVATENESRQIERSNGSTPCYYSAPGSICNAHGTTNPKYTGYTRAFIVPDEIYCRAISLNRECLSFVYHPTNRSCKPIYSNLTYAQFKPGTSEGVYFENTCFSCIDTCPKNGMNLLLNSGFEKYPHNPAPWNGRVPDFGKYIQIGPGYNSDQAAIYRNTGYADLSQTFYTCGNRPYLMSYVYKFIFGKRRGYALITTFAEDTSSTVIPTLTQNNTWLPYVEIFTTSWGPDSGGFSEVFNTLRRGQYDSGSVSIDDFKVRPVDLQLIPSAPNLVQNPTFEGGSIQGWQSKECKISPQGQGYQSNYSAECVATGNGFEDSPYSLRQTLTTQVNVPYVISFDYKSLNLGSNARCFLYYKFGRVEASPSKNFLNDTWFTYKGFVLAHSETTRLGLGYDQPNGYKCVFYFDNIEVRKVSVGM